jgi:hypothetical protein
MGVISLSLISKQRFKIRKGILLAYALVKKIKALQPVKPTLLTDFGQRPLFASSRSRWNRRAALVTRHIWQICALLHELPLPKKRPRREQ